MLLIDKSVEEIFTKRHWIIGHKNGKKVTGEANFTFLGGLVTATGSIGATPPDSGCSEFHHQLFCLGFCHIQ